MPLEGGRRGSTAPGRAQTAAAARSAWDLTADRVVADLVVEVEEVAEALEAAVVEAVVAVVAAAGDSETATAES